MTSKQEEFRLRMDRFKDALSRHGVKLTHQRMVIFQEVIESKEHPNAELVYKTVQKKLPMISLDTVYRTLWKLQDLGLIRVLGVRDRVRFDGNMRQHHHFVCCECGLLRDFCSNEYDGLAIPKVVQSMGNGETVQVEVRGICNKCSKKLSTKKNRVKKKGRRNEEKTDE
jgi:Fur family transcriptional regulator, peroxide stress response regulator